MPPLLKIAHPQGHKPRVLVFRNELLPLSETFILAQAMALKRFQPCFAGVHAASHSLQLPSTPRFIDAGSSSIGKVRRRLFWSSGFAPPFYREVERLRPALIHAHFAVDGAAALPLAQRLRIPLVVTMHGYDITSSASSLSRSPEGRLYLRRREQLQQQASIFLCVSQFLYDRALQQGYPREKLRVLYTGVDLTEFRSASAARDPNLILFVGRLVEKKGCRYLLEALANLRAEHPAAHAVCIGAGPLRQELEAQAATGALRCTFLGPQPAAVVRDCVARARILCVPSVRARSGDCEGLGMVFAEAQAMGTPVVSFRHGGIPEVVQHGRTGLLAPEGNSSTLAAHLQRLLTDDACWKDFSAAGKVWIAAGFNLARQTALLEDVYARTLADFAGSHGQH